MPEQTNSVSSGLSPMLKTARTGKPSSVAEGDLAVKKGSGFSSDLDKANQQQMEKVRVASSPRGNSTQTSQTSSTDMKNESASQTSAQTNEVVESGRSEDALADAQIATSATETLKPIGSDRTVDDSLTAIGQQQADESEQPLAVALKLPEDPAATLTDAGKTGDKPVVVPDELQKQKQQKSGSTDAALATASSAPMAAAQRGSVGQAATLDKSAGRSSWQTNALELPSGVRSADGERLSPTSLGKTGDGTLEATGRVTTEQSLELGSRKSPSDLSAAVGNAAARGQGNPHSLRDAAGAVVTEPEQHLPGQADKSGLTQVNAVGLTQVASANGVVTQAALAERFRQAGNEAGGKSVGPDSKHGDSPLMQVLTPSLNVRGPEKLAMSEMPLTLESDNESGVESLMGAANGIKTVQQRIANTEAMLSQMASEAGTTSVKVPVADNPAPVLTLGNVAGLGSQPTVPVAGPIIQAPLNIPLASEDAETALAGNVKWMTNEGVKNAVMTVTPHGMGPISVKVGINGDQMDVSIIASQHTTRDALESMLPRLREQLTVQGHESVKLEVSDGKSEQSRSGNGQTYAESRDPAGSSPKDNQSNSSNHGENTQKGRSDQLQLNSESFMAEDLQRVAARVAGEVEDRPVFDAYV